jgi:hypothetical protein
MPADPLTVADEHAHTTQDGSRLGISRSVAGAAAGGQDMLLANGAVRTVAGPIEPVDAIRVTYSF